jgi:predicted dehydrogenase
MKFLIAGLGSIGRRHLRNLVALGQDDIVLYRTHHSTLPDEELGAFPVEADLAGALKDHPDAVIISNPTALHLSVALPAARMGCHLLMEKPVAEKIDQGVVDLMATVDSMAVRTLVGFQFRFHPVLVEIKEILTTNQMGRPLSFRVHWGEYLPGWHPWEDYRQSYAARKDLGGGVVNTLSHPLDYVRWLFGEVKSVTAVTKKVSDLEIDVEDVAEILLEFEDGLVGSIHLDYFQRPPAHWIEINCQKGQIRWENESGAGRIFRIDSGSPQIIHPPQGFERNDLFLDELRHFLLLLNGKTESRCSLADGVAALKLTEAVHQSSVEGKKVFLG